MPPRLRSAATPPPSHAPTLLDLPDELLLNILARCAPSRGSAGQQASRARACPSSRTRLLPQPC
jgi:hypothetical protein